LEERHCALRLLGGKMIAALSNTVSALRSFVTKLGVTADNIANVNTDGFKKGRAALHENHNGAVRVEISRDTSPGFRYDVVENNKVVEKETSNVDLVEEIPDLMITKRAYQANLKTLGTQDEMLGSLLDTIG
jgi:flagellar basal body rod protein FlgG